MTREITKESLPVPKRKVSSSSQYPSIDEEIQRYQKEQQEVATVKRPIQKLEALRRDSSTTLGSCTPDRLLPTIIGIEAREKTPKQMTSTIIPTSSKKQHPKTSKIPFSNNPS
jgi:hypothetical protein